MSAKICSRLAFALACLLALPSMAAAQDGLPPLLDRELFFGNPEYAAGQISPNGQYISFTRPHDGVMNVWVKAFGAELAEARPITADARPVMGYFWTPDSRYVLYVQDRGGDENFHVFRIDPRAEPEADTGVPPAVNLTPIDGVRTVIYALPRNAPGIALIGLNHRDRAWHDLYRLDISSGERQRLVLNDRQITSWLIDADGVAHAATRTDLATGATQILRVVDGKLGEAIYSCSVTETCRPIHVQPGSGSAYTITNSGDRDLIELVRLDLQTGRTTFVERDPQGRVDFAGAIFSNVDDRLLATVYIDDRIRLEFRDAALEADFAFARARLPEGNVLPGSGTLDERVMLVSASSDRDPGSVYIFDRDARTIERLFRDRPELPTEHLAEMRAVRYTARDGLEIPAYLTLPRGVEPRNLPVIVFPHGGPWARDVWFYNPYVQFFANRGYAVLQPNFRGSTGFGKAFLDAGNRQWGTGYMQHDITDGVLWLIEQGIADPARVGIAGISYGGYAALAGLAFTPELYAAGVSIVGPSNIITLLNSIPPYWEAVRRMFHERIGDPTTPEGRQQLIEQSPLFSADRIVAPLLVVQGANDPRVVQHESDQIVVALRERDFPVQYIVAPDEGHGFRDELNRLAYITAMEHFLAEHLGGRAQQDVRAEIRERLAAITVDPATVVLAEPEDLAALPDAAFAGEALVPMAATYDIRMSVMGQEMEFTQVSTTERAEFAGQPAWRFTSSGALMGMALADTVYAHPQTLAPKARRVAQGPQRVTIDYGQGTVSASVGQMGTTEAAFEGVIAVDGPAFDFGLGTLPLATGYRTRVQLFDLLQGHVRAYVLEVVGEETVTVPAGSFRAHVVELRPADGSARRTVHVAVESPRLVVRQVIPLPAQMGGGTATAELVAVEGG
jgi:dipeptidyl aminopeptidase/acylaminoacyl peptidase